MSVDVLRTSDGWWVESGGTARAVDIAPETTTGRLLTARDHIAHAADRTREVSVSDLHLLSPVTTPCRVVAQMVNYYSHARDSGIDPHAASPTFFRKASNSISGPHAPIHTPEHVRLLDYEIELGLVLRAELGLGTVVTEDDLHHYIGALVVADDVSARDVQLAQGQFYEGKSYPTFTPVGPRLTLVDAADLARLGDLRLTLAVDGEIRQDRTAADMIVPPAQALTALARFQPLSPGDLLLTGTPGGTALKAPPPPVRAIGRLLPERFAMRAFLDRQAKQPAYLRPGNVVTAHIATADRSLDLGVQRTEVVGSAS
ncbi:MAG: fumarylacetoacetate hydrolase family protein [Dermatophilaceae bacterium]